MVPLDLRSLDWQFVVRLEVAPGRWEQAEQMPLDSLGSPRTQAEPGRACN